MIKAPAQARDLSADGTHAFVVALGGLMAGKPTLIGDGVNDPLGALAAEAEMHALEERALAAWALEIENHRSSPCIRALRRARARLPKDLRLIGLVGY